MTLSTRNEIAVLFANLACEAGAAIMRARVSGPQTLRKTDGSPVTQADLDADRCIRDGLARAMPSVPVVTEEDAGSHGVCEGQRFILVDPLDGTREFVDGRDEFTVNIALIEHNVPVVGAIYAPALGSLYLSGEGAWRIEIAPGAAVSGLSAMQPIAASAVPEDGWRVVASRSHLDLLTQDWLACHEISELCNAGSSLKFCAIAEGAADVYPRLSPTMEWDTAAGHAILLAAGGVVTGPDGAPLTYGKPDFRNTQFVAWGRRA